MNNLLSVHSHGFRMKLVSFLFFNSCTNLADWTLTGTGNWTISTTSGQTCLYSPDTAMNTCYMNSGLASFKGTTISFKMYATGGCPDFYFSCNSSGGGAVFRWEQRNNTTSGFNNNSNWNTVYGAGGSYTWPQNTWFVFSIQVTSSMLATAYVNGVSTGLSATVTDGGGYFGFNSDGGGGTLSINNIKII